MNSEKSHGNRGAFRCFSCCFRGFSAVLVYMHVFKKKIRVSQPKIDISNSTRGNPLGRQAFESLRLRVSSTPLPNPLVVLSEFLN